jgi:hypothetical protein
MTLATECGIATAVVKTEKPRQEGPRTPARETCTSSSGPLTPRSPTPISVVSIQLDALAREHMSMVADLLLPVPQLPINPYEVLSNIRTAACTVPTGALGPPRLSDRDRERLLYLVTLGALALCARAPDDQDTPPDTPPAPSTVRQGGRA